MIIKMTILNPLCILPDYAPTDNLKNIKTNIRKIHREMRQEKAYLDKAMENERELKKVATQLEVLLETVLRMVHELYRQKNESM